MAENDNISNLFLTLGEGIPETQLALAMLQGAISAEISMRRQALGMNQQQFAEHMGVTQSMVSKWESGEANFTLKTLVEIAVKLGIELQSPFVVPPLQVYSCPGTSNVYPFPKSWRSARYTLSTTPSYEVKEM